MLCSKVQKQVSKKSYLRKCRRWVRRSKPSFVKKFNLLIQKLKFTDTLLTRVPVHRVFPATKISMNSLNFFCSNFKIDYRHALDNSSPFAFLSIPEKTKASKTLKLPQSRISVSCKHYFFLQL